MDMQVPYSVYPEISKKSNLSSVKKRYTRNHSRFVKMERSRNYRKEYDARSYTHLGKYPTENECNVVYKGQNSIPLNFPYDINFFACSINFRNHQIYDFALVVKGNFIPGIQISRYFFDLV